jgi:hypothetical protein
MREKFKTQYPRTHASQVHLNIVLSLPVLVPIKPAKPVITKADSVPINKPIHRAKVGFII